MPRRSGSPLGEVTPSNNSESPPADSRGCKNLHSPWTAEKGRKKRWCHDKDLGSNLTISEECEYKSPPKRHNGAPGGPGARLGRL
jgi:hypothetical protein